MRGRIDVGRLSVDFRAFAVHDRPLTACYSSKAVLVGVSELCALARCGHPGDVNLAGLQE